MSAGETNFIQALRALATDPAARGLMDDAAVLGDLVLTHDMIAENVHFLSSDPPEDVAWKLAAVNFSDLAAKGAKPLGVLMGYALTGDAAWDAAFIVGLGSVLKAFDVPLLGGDTIALPKDAQRVFGLTAIGRAPACGAPSRTGAKAGDALFVTGTIGDAGLGLAVAQGTLNGSAFLLSAYRTPFPRLADGQALAPYVHAMMDVSDGLLIDAARMTEANGLSLSIDLDVVPLSAAFRQVQGDRRVDRIKAATAGDDYQLLFAAASDSTLPVPATKIGQFADGAGISLFDASGPVPLPAHLGYLHR